MTTKVLSFLGGSLQIISFWLLRFSISWGWVRLVSVVLWPWNLKWAKPMIGLNKIIFMALCWRWVFRSSGWIQLWSVFPRLLIHSWWTGNWRILCALKEVFVRAPYLFLLCAEGLGAMIKQAYHSRLLSGISITKEAPTITHLFFADDSIIFTHATVKEAETISRILRHYE